MRRTIAKLVAMLLMLALVLTGCGVKDDPMKEIEKQRAEIEKAYSAVVAEYDGGEITIFEVMAPFYSTYSYMEQIYGMFGMQISEEEIAAMQEDAVEAELINRAIAKEFEARGMTLDKSEEDIKGEVNAIMEEGIAYYLEMVEGDTEEIKRAAAELAMYGEGLSIERMVDLYRTNDQGEALQAVIEAEITEISEEDLQTTYESRLAADQEMYTANPSYYEEDLMNDVPAICWVPEGYRTVKHVLVIPEEAVMTAVTDARSALKTAQTELSNLETELQQLVTAAETETEAETTEEGEEVRTSETVLEEINAKNAAMPELESAVVAAEEACLAAVKEKTDLIYADLEAGKPIDEVMAAYGEDPGMQSEPYMTTGYHVCAESYTWDQNFTDGAMALEKVGDYSAEPVISASGVHIIYYNSDVVSGPVALEEIHDELYDEALAALRNEHFQTVLAELVNALNPVYHIENWTMD